MVKFTFIQFEGYKFDPNGEYVRRWLPELARLPTEWIHHPWNAPDSVLQAAGVELGSNYPLPIVEIDAAKARLQGALTEMWHLEAASRATVENGLEEGLGDSSELPQDNFPPELRMEVDRQPVQIINGPSVVRRHGDQMVPTVTSSLVRSDDGEVSVGSGNSSEEGRGEVPYEAHFAPETRTEEAATQTERNPTEQHRTRGMLLTVAEPSSSWMERDSGLVPVWSPSVSSSQTEQFMTEETDIGSDSYLSMHSQSRQIMNWQQLSPTR